jgi:hypothetical protein
MDPAQQAVARLAQLGLPSRALEDWRYVDTAPLGVVPTAPRAKVDTGHGDADIVIVDGRIHLARGLTAVPAPLGDPRDDHARLWALAGPGDATSLMVAGERRLDLRSIATGGAHGWRLHLAVAPGATLDLTMEHHDPAAMAGGHARSAGWLTLSIGRGAQVTVRERHVGAQSCCLAAVDAEVAQDAGLTWTAVSSGGGLLRQHLSVRLAGPGAACDLAMADRVGGRHQAHRLTRVIHAAPLTRSRQVIKAIVDGHAAASCDALISVAVGSDGTDADLQNRNLVLSPTARADTRPQLDIRADEVKAAHGATVGRLDAEETLYLRMRGLGAEAARDLLITAFIDEVAGRLG